MLTRTLSFMDTRGLTHDGDCANLTWSGNCCGVPGSDLLVNRHSRTSRLAIQPIHFDRTLSGLVPTFSLFGILIVLGIWGWGDLAIPNWLRFGGGIPLILLGNVIVWFEVAHFGMPQTGGARGTLRTTGTYRFSRNPQYMADIAIVGGWVILSSATWTLAEGAAAILVLIAAPFSEEPWLKEQYGSAFEAYAARVRRFL